MIVVPASGDIPDCRADLGFYPLRDKRIEPGCPIQRVQVMSGVELRVESEAVRPK